MVKRKRIQPDSHEPKCNEAQLSSTAVRYSSYCTFCFCLFFEADNRLLAKHNSLSLTHFDIHFCRANIYLVLKVSVYVDRLLWFVFIHLYWMLFMSWASAHIFSYSRHIYSGVINELTLLSIGMRLHSKKNYVQIYAKTLNMVLFVEWLACCSHLVSVKQGLPHHIHEPTVPNFMRELTNIFFHK